MAVPCVKYKVNQLNDTYEGLWSIASKNNIVKHTWKAAIFSKSIKCLMVTLVQILFNVVGQQHMFEFNAERDITDPKRLAHLENIIADFLKAPSLVELVQEIISNNRFKTDFTGVLRDADSKIRAVTNDCVEFFKVDINYALSCLNGTLSVVAPQIHIQEEDVLKPNSLDAAYAVAKHIVGKNNNPVRNIYNKWYNDAAPSEIKKRQMLLITMMMPYIRLGTFPKGEAYFFEKGTMTPTQNWLAYADGAYRKVMKDKIDAALDLITSQQWQTIIENLQQIETKLGFPYGSKFLSFKDETLLKNELTAPNTYRNRYSLRHLRAIYNNIFEALLGHDNSLSHSQMVSKIVECNPHYMINALTTLSMNTIMDIPRQQLVALYWPQGLVYLDVSELALMILSSKGKNEHMGLPDVPEKGQIWYHTFELENIMQCYIYLANTKNSSDIAKRICAEIMSTIQSMIDGTVQSLKNDWDTINDDLKVNVLGTVITKAINARGSGDEEDLFVLALATSILKAEEHKIQSLSLFLKDINLVHMIGYLGWIMLSDNSSSFSQDPEYFPITNACKVLFEKYILRMSNGRDVVTQQAEEEEEGAEYFYSLTEVVDKLKQIEYNGINLQSVLNSSTCLHGIGSNLIVMYLCMLREIQHAHYNNVLKHVPVHFNKNRLRPLAMFARVSESEYIYCIKERWDASTYTVQTANIGIRTSSWCGHVMYTRHNEQSYKYKRYANDFRFVPKHIKSPKVQTYLTAQKDAAVKLLRATDQFMMHRKQHFRLLARYCVDFARVIQDNISNDNLFKYDPTNNEEWFGTSANTDGDMSADKQYLKTSCTSTTWALFLDCGMPSRHKITSKQTLTRS